jgi:hypothetical protein
MNRTAWIIAGSVAVTMIVLIAVASYIVTRFDGQRSIELSAISCRWDGKRVIMSGVVHNPSSSSQTVIVVPTFRFARGGQENSDVTINSSQFTSVPARSTLHWSADVTPPDVAKHLGQKITACDPSAPGATIDEQQLANDG